MSAPVEQAKWAVVLLMRENAPGVIWLEDELDLDALDLDVALRGFSRAVSRGNVDERFTAVEALACGWAIDVRSVRSCADSEIPSGMCVTPPRSD